jgi:hypothetical protein
LRGPIDLKNRAFRSPIPSVVILSHQAKDPSDARQNNHVGNSLRQSFRPARVGIPRCASE